MPDVAQLPSFWRRDTMVDHPNNAPDSATESSRLIASNKVRILPHRLEGHFDQSRLN
jgi:hypothetical protein